MPRTLSLALLALALLAGPAAPSHADGASLAITAGDATAASVSAQTRRDVLQAVVEHFRNLALNAVDRPGNIPPDTPAEKPAVLAVTKAVQDKPALQAFGRDVVYKTRAEIGSEQLINFLMIEAVDIKSDAAAEVKLFYPYRAMLGTVRLARADGGWQVDTTELGINSAGAQMFYKDLFYDQECRDGSEYARWENGYYGIGGSECPGKAVDAEAVAASAPAAEPAKGKKPRRNRPRK